MQWCPGVSMLLLITKKQSKAYSRGSGHPRLWQPSQKRVDQVSGAVLGTQETSWQKGGCYLSDKDQLGQEEPCLRFDTPTSQ